MKINKAEYFLLRNAVTTHQWFREVAYKSGLSHVEVASAANRLFQSGDIIARVFANEQDHQGTPNIILTMSDIQANLDDKLIASYELTPQGGARWEILANADWNRYFTYSYSESSEISEDEVFEYELMGTSQQLIEYILSVRDFIISDFPIPDTEVWEILEPWEPTYWKTLPLGYKVTYQAKERMYIGEDTPPDWREIYWQVNQWYSEIKEWYKDPEFEKEQLIFPNYIKIDENVNKKAEYLILRAVVERYGNYEQDFGGVSLNCKLSQSETLTAAHSLFQKGYILAEVYRDGNRFSDVVMTIPEIQADLDGKLQAYYYLTPQGGAYWETLAHPDWFQYYTDSCHDYKPYELSEFECEMISADRELLEQILKVDCYLFDATAHIPGTEVWEELEPWKPTYWKTLPFGYRVRYKARQMKMIKNSNSLEEEMLVNQARQWFLRICQWYTDPIFE